jgi:hypothetical protein
LPVIGHFNFLFIAFSLVIIPTDSFSQVSHSFETWVFSLRAIAEGPGQHRRGDSGPSTAHPPAAKARRKSERRGRFAQDDNKKQKRERRT